MRLPAPPVDVARRPFLAVAALFLVGDVLLVALFAVFKLGWVQDPMASLGLDGGYAEVVQYLKTLWVGLCAGWLTWRTREPVFAALAALFAGLLVDDAGRLHEVWGARLADALALPSVAGLRPVDLGETLFLALWVGPVFLFGVAAYRRSAPPARATARWALGALAVLAAFGVGADALHQSATALVDVDGLDGALTLLEEGGELVTMSVLVAGAVACVLGRPGGRGGPSDDRPARGAERGGAAYRSTQYSGGMSCASARAPRAPL